LTQNTIEHILSYHSHKQLAESLMQTVLREAFE